MCALDQCAAAMPHIERALASRALDDAAIRELDELRAMSEQAARER
jgi:hypothetical protein